MKLGGGGVAVGSGVVRLGKVEKQESRVVVVRQPQRLVE